MEGENSLENEREAGGKKRRGWSFTS